MIVAALVVPSAPMLLPGYVGLADPAGELRDRVTAVLRDALADVDVVVVVAAAERAPRHTKGSLAGRVARRLLDAAGWSGPVEEIGIPLDATAEEVAAQAGAASAVAGRALLLVPADGSAKRTEKAPGHFDDRAAPMDDAVLAALRAADTDALLALDSTVCEELWLTGRASLQVLAGALRDRPVTGELLWSDDPFGVLYVIARWVIAR